MSNHVLSLLIFLPTIIAIVILLGFGFYHKITKITVQAVTAIELMLAAFLVSKVDTASSTLQMVEKQPWVSSYRIQYFVGMDGLNSAFILLTTVIFFLSAVFCNGNKKANSAFYALMLVLETCILGVFCAQDLFLFFTFWTAMIMPIYFMISYWGGENKDKAAARFFMSQMLGTLLLVIGIFAVYYQSSPHTFDMTELVGGKFSDAVFTIGNKQFHFEKLMYWIFFISLALRMPIAPVHSWFVHLQSEATTVLSAIVAAVFIKTGMYALLKLNYGMFTNASKELAHLFTIIAVVNIVYASFCAISQKEIKKMVSYAAICANGIILFGFSNFTSAAMQGAYLQTILSGLVFGAMAFLTEVLASRNSTNKSTIEFEKYSGLFSKVPVMTFFYTLTLFSIIGLPGFGSFISQTMILLGGFEAHKILATIVVFGALLTSSYLMWMYRKVFLGNANESAGEVMDLTIRERVSVAPLILFSIVLGLSPGFLINMSSVSITQLLESLGK